MEKEIINKLTELYNSGMSLRKISKKYNISLGSLHYNLKKNGVIFAIPKLISKIDKNKLISMYNDGNSTRDISKITGISKSQVFNILQQNIILRDKSQSLRDKDVNHSFFKEYNKESCYWGGFISADGCVWGNRLLIKLAIIDKKHLIKFNNQIGRKKDIKEFFRKHASVIFDTGSKEIRCDLKNNFNITENKSLTLEPPQNIQKTFVVDFIRGYLDGDGGMNKNLKNPKLYFAGTYNFLSWVKIKLQENIPGIGNPSVRISAKNNKIHKLEFGGGRQCPKIANWLYLNSTNETRLDRKYEIAKEYINYGKSKGYI